MPMKVHCRELPVRRGGILAVAAYSSVIFSVNHRAPKVNEILRVIKGKSNGCTPQVLAFSPMWRPDKSEQRPHHSIGPKKTGEQGETTRQSRPPCDDQVKIVILESARQMESAFSCRQNAPGPAVTIPAFRPKQQQTVLRRTGLKHYLVPISIQPFRGGVAQGEVMVYRTLRSRCLPSLPKAKPDRGSCPPCPMTSQHAL